MSAARLYSVGLCFGLAWLVTGATAQTPAPATTPKAAASATTAPDAKPADTKTAAAASPGGAKIYIIRAKGIPSVARLTTFDVLVDGRKVGELPAGTYVLASRPPGHHTVEMQNGAGGIFFASCKGEMTLAAGMTYYVGAGPAPTGAPGTDLINFLMLGTTGKQLPGDCKMNWTFYLLDDATGQQELAKLGVKAH